MTIEVKALSVNCGDALLVRYLGTDKKYHNILIDGGYVKTYKAILKPELHRIKNAGEKIDLIIVTHYDLDHIGGILALINDKDFDLSTLITEWWLNVDLPFVDDSGLISVKQLNTLKDYLRKEGKYPSIPITTKSTPAFFFGAKITVLSPDEDGYNKAKDHIEKKTKTIAKTMSDYGKRAMDFDIDNDIKQDDSIPNGSSIAILFEIEDKKLVFLADSHPSVVLESLQHLGYDESNKLKIDAVKLSHHGSKFNFSSSLFKVVETANFIVSANGINRENLPNKETISKILLLNNYRNRPLYTFFFTHQNSTLEQMFNVDGENVFEKLNFNFSFPMPASNGTIIQV